MSDITPIELKDRLEAGDNLILVDVREPYEHEDFNIGGVNIPITELPFRIEEINNTPEAEIILYCQSGNRSALAQKLLATQFQIENTLNLQGGMKSWKATFNL